jgi:energy-coupling factor transporter ATP-binding protein EcfA2
MARQKNATAAVTSAPNAWAPGVRSIHTPVPLGVYEDGSTAEVALWNTGGGRHTFLVGATGSGKTNTLNVLMAGLMPCYDTVVWVIDVAKRGKSLAPWLSCIDWLVTNPSDAVVMLQCVNRVIDARALAGARMAATGEGDAVMQPTAKQPLLIVVIDEAAALLGRDSAEAAHATEELTRISETGREVAVGSVISTQKPTQDSLGNSGRLKSQLNPVLSGRMNRLSDLRWAMTNAPAESLNLGVFTMPGVLLMQDGADASALPLRSYPLFEPATVAKLAQVYASHRPRLDPASTLAAGPAYARRSRDPLGIDTPASSTTDYPDRTDRVESVAVQHDAAPGPAGVTSRASADNARQAWQTARAAALAAMEAAENAPPLPGQPLATITALHPAEPVAADPQTLDVVTAVLTGARKPLSRAEIQAQTQMSKASVCRALAALGASGKLTRSKDGVIRLYQIA